MNLRQAAEMACATLDHAAAVADRPGLMGMCEQAAEILRAALAEADDRKCTCHPDDNPPQPCPKQFALGECRRVIALAEADEPVAWFESPYGEVRVNPLYKFQFPSSLLSWQIPLYTRPPRREPLTKIGELVLRKLTSMNGIPVERCTVKSSEVDEIRLAHGIGTDE